MEASVPAEVSAGLLSRCESTFEGAVSAASELQADGDALLAEALLVLTGWHRVAVAAALGDVHGAHGATALRRALQATGPGTRDLVCAAALALAKRKEPSTTQDLLATLTASKDGTVREYAIVGLAYAGDGAGWDDVFAWLTSQVRRSKRPASHEPATIFALCYLLSYSDAPADRASRVATLLNNNQDRISTDERAWLATYWPQLQGKDYKRLPTPPSESFRAWVSSRALFR